MARKKHYIKYPDFHPAMKNRVSFEMALFCKQIKPCSIEELTEHRKDNSTTQRKHLSTIVDRKNGFDIGEHRYFEIYKGGRFCFGNGNYRRAHYH